MKKKAKAQKIKNKELLITRNTKQNWIVLLVVLICLIFLSTLPGCRPTYPSGNVAQSIVKICKYEYNLDVTAKIVGKTVGVYIPLDSLLDSSLQLAPNIGEKISDVALSVQRVVLSTDRDLDFYLIKACDIKNIGAEFTLIGYIQDIKKARSLYISRTDYYQRLLRNLKLNLKVIGDKEGNYFQFTEVSLPKFLTEQISKRIETKFKEDKELNIKFKTKDINGEFKDRTFEFVINIAEKPIVPLNSQRRKTLTESRNVFNIAFRIIGNSFKRKEEDQNPFSIVLNIISYVIHEYEFKDFDGVKVTNTQNKKTLNVSNKNLELLRIKKISLKDLWFFNYKPKS